MNDYEILLMRDPELPEERQGEILTRTQELVKKHDGEWENQETWGRRRLAYEIDHKPEAVYHLLLRTAPPETLDEITRVLKITDGVLRHGFVVGVHRGTRVFGAHHVAHLGALDIKSLG